MVDVKNVNKCIVDAEKYAIDVRDGNILASKYIKKAVERYFEDRATGHERGLFFDESAAAYAISFFPAFLRFSKGKWSGKPFVLQPWQSFILWCLFGWYKEDGTRRFRRLYVKVARKNGKSEFMAGLELFMAYFDGEAGAEIYSVATKKDQAAIVFKAVKQMVKSSPQLQKIFKVWKHEIEVVGGGVIKALGSDADTLDGSSPYLTVVDEYHAHKDDSVYDVMQSGMGARTNPIIAVITTAGHNLDSPCRDMELYCKGILDGIFKDDGLLSFIYELDEDDLKVSESISYNPLTRTEEKRFSYGWANPANFIKASPNLGVSVKVDDLIAEANEAIRRTRKRKEFLTKKCAVWVNAPDTWIKVEDWKASGWQYDMNLLVGRDCYIGFDLGSTNDFTAVSYLFPIDDFFVLKVDVYISEVMYEERTGKIKDIMTWVDDGHITVTNGNATDYNVIEADIQNNRAMYNIRHGYYDPHNATQLATRLDPDGEWLTGLPQSTNNLAEATKLFEEAILKKQINHLNNPTLAWMANNVSLRKLPSGGAIVSKRHSVEKVDGIAASIIAFKCEMDKRNSGEFGFYFGD